MEGRVSQPEERVPRATVRIGTREFAASPGRPFVFGRAEGDGVVGLEAADMGISAFAGSVEWDGVWFVVNTSRKCELFLDQGGVEGVQALDCGHRHAVNVERLCILVKGSIRTHQITVTVPAEDLASVDLDRPSSGTLIGGVTLTETERDAVVALFEGYLLPPPRRQPWPRTYAEAARRLGGARTKDGVRRQMERLKLRLAATGRYFEGSRANYELAEYLIADKVISTDDLGRLALDR